VGASTNLSDTTREFAQMNTAWGREGAVVDIVEVDDNDAPGRGIGCAERRGKNET
jgi:hypothetical protein